jgi:energy-coupling factor transporter ATP-binding protein EcfA2
LEKTIFQYLQQNNKTKDRFKNINEVYDFLNKQKKSSMKVTLKYKGKINNDIKECYLFLENLQDNENLYQELFETIERKEFYPGGFRLRRFLIANDFDILKKNIDLMAILPSCCFKINILDSNNKQYENLSNGEKSILRIKSYIEVFSNQHKNKDCIILLDEPANDMHPDWQKKLLSYLVNTFKNREQKFHFIITTHSPFLLSDIPKQNIIFLDTDKNGNCKVVNGLNDEKQTFGANIHTLLRDSFFMEDGLMGEFAKSKINEIIDFHKIVEQKKHKECLKKIYEKRKDRFWDTQKIIGEDYLKQVVKNHLVEIEKILLGKDKAKEEEIKRTKAYLKSLKNG